MKNNFLIVLTAVTLVYSQKAQSTFNLTLLHTNDVHARVDEAHKYGGICSPSLSAKGSCVGGSARL